MLRRGLHSLGLEEKLPRIVAVDHERLIVTTETVGELASPSLKGSKSFFENYRKTSNHGGFGDCEIRA
jgi:hypothetical protein